MPSIIIVVMVPFSPTSIGMAILIPGNRPVASGGAIDLGGGEPAVLPRRAGAQQVAQLYGGCLEPGTSPLGGLRVLLTLPIA